MNKKIIISILTTVLFFLIVEVIIRVNIGNPSVEIDSKNYKFSYLDMYDYIPGRPISDFKLPDTIRVFIIGGSVASSFPEYLLESCLNSIIGYKSFEVFNCGQGGYDAYRTYMVEKNIISKQPDILIVFSGNNEYFDPVKINLTAHYLNKFLRKSYSYRILQDKVFKWLQFKGFYKIRSREKRLVDYEKNILKIINLAKKNKIPIMMCTLPINSKDVAPGGSSSDNENFIKGRYYLENNENYFALDYLVRFLESEPENTLGLYYLGVACEKIGEYEKAQKYYLQAVDSPFNWWSSAKPSSNMLLRQICKDQDVILVDLESDFIKISKHGLVGKELMRDNCHWYKREYSIVVRSIIEKILVNKHYFHCLFEVDFKNIQFDGVEKIISDFKKANSRDFAFKGDFCGLIYRCTMSSNYEFYNVSESDISDLKIMHFIDSNLLERVWLLKSIIKQAIIETAYLNESVVDFSDEYEKNWPYVLYVVGEAFRQLNMFQRALIYFDYAINLRNDFYSAYLGKALAYNALGETQKAYDNLSKAGEINSSVELQYYRELFK